MKDRNLKIILGITAIALFVSLILRLWNAPGGMILSGLFLGGMVLVGILCIGFIAAFILWLFVKKYSLSTLYFLIISILFSAYHYRIYSPTLKITVPDGYHGRVDLVLSNVDNNILTIDSNGIGYITQWPFKKTWAKPDVYTVSGQKINDLTVGFNNSAFFGSGKLCCIDGLEVRSLSFEIVPADKRVKNNIIRRISRGSIPASC